MNLSMKWLNDYINIDYINNSEADIKDFIHGMTMSGSKVETYRDFSSEIKNVIVGKILEIKSHPDADKLLICKVKIKAKISETEESDKNSLQIVTGASNLKEGDFIPVAADGAVLPNGTKIKAGKLRGALSEGMLCSLGELGLSKNDFPSAIEDGIFVLNGEDITDEALGENICGVIGLDDIQVEFEITSNRPDCLSVTGLAREAGAWFKLPVNIKPPVVKGCGDDIKNYLDVTIENSGLCRRYIAKVVKNIKIGPSPRWMRERLRVSGVRPINNLVDITNYVMLEYGNPMHAFDIKYIKGNKIIVGNAKDGETITTLDDVKRELSNEMLVIRDAESPVAVAGIMGGEYSGIMDDTSTVVFEGACFDGGSVRATAKKLGLRTDSSVRFEKGLDPRLCLNSIMRACELVEILGAGEVVDGIIDVYPCEHKGRKISMDWDWVNKFLGTCISREEMTDILKSLDFEIDGDIVLVPPFRTDIEEKADIAEEIARIYGYNKIPSSVIMGIADAAFSEKQLFIRNAHNIFTAMGFYEITTFSFISPGEYDKINLPADSPKRNSVRLINPLGEDTSIMRTTLLPSMLNALAFNYNNRNMNIRLYETGKVYIEKESEKENKKERELPDENDVLAVGIYGEGEDFYSLKGAIEIFLERTGVKDYDIVPIRNNSSFHTGKCAGVLKNDILLAVFGEIHPAVAEKYGLCTVFAAEINLNDIFALGKPEKQYKPLPKYPSTTRDLSLVCAEDTPAAEIEKIIRASIGTELEDLALFDLYRGSQIGEGKKSLSYSIRMRAGDRTMTVEEADKLIAKSLFNLEKIDVKLR